MTNKEAIKKLERLKNEFLEEYLDYDGTTSAYDMAIKALQEPERKHAKWRDVREYCGDFMCSNCEGLFSTNKYNYCPDCGAKMDKE